MAKQWLRIGECQRCGKCCIMQNLTTTPALQLKIDPKLAAFLETEQGAQIQCIHLKYDIEGKAVCDVYDTDSRPAFCIAHPSSPASVVEGCVAFTFIEKESE